MVNPAFCWLLAVKFLAFWKLQPRSWGTNTLLVPQPECWGPVSPGPYGCCAYMVAELLYATRTFRKSHSTNYKDLRRKYAVLAITGCREPGMTPSASVFAFVFISAEFSHYCALDKWIHDGRRARASVVQVLYDSKRTYDNCQSIRTVLVVQLCYSLRRLDVSFCSAWPVSRMGGDSV